MQFITADGIASLLFPPITDRYELIWDNRQEKLVTFLDTLATNVTLFQGWQCGSRIKPAPYEREREITSPTSFEKAQASEVICKRAAHPGSKLNQKKCRVGRACACVCLHVYWSHMPLCLHVCMLEPLCHP